MPKIIIFCNARVLIFTAGFSASPPIGSAPGKMRTMPPPATLPTAVVSGSSSSPDTQEADDFVMVPAHLAMDAAEHRKTSQKVPHAGGGKISGRRHTVSGAHPNIRPNNLPMQIGQTEPIPVPTQKAAYQQIQQSLVRSRSRSGDSVSAMSGISSASGGSTLGPLPEERVAKNMERPMEQSPAGIRKQAHVSPQSPIGENKRKVSAPPAIPDICQLSPPNVTFTLGGTPPTAAQAGFGHRRRTSSSSSCGTPPPTGQWQISPNR